VNPSPRLRGALSHGVARVAGSPFAKPVARVVLVAAGLVLLAIIGHAGAAGAFGGPVAASLFRPDASAGLGLAVPFPVGPLGATAPQAANPAQAASAGPPAQGAPSHGAASADDPVILNTAATEDLRRLPGIGPKRADAILALRTRLGRFRAIEDLLKVKGIGRATLKRLRPLVRLDPPVSVPDAGSTAR
jgi:competence protein ComEA